MSDSIRSEQKEEQLPSNTPNTSRRSKTSRSSRASKKRYHPNNAENLRKRVWKLRKDKWRKGPLSGSTMRDSYKEQKMERFILTIINIIV